MALLISGAAAALLTLASVLYYVRRWRFFAAATQAPGRVVRNEVRVVRRQRQTRREFFPIVEFEVEGTTMQLTGSVGARAPRYAVGASVPVHFLPGNPGDAILGTGEEQWFEARLFAVFAFFGWVTCAVIAVVAR